MGYRHLGLLPLSLESSSSVDLGLSRSHVGTSDVFCRETSSCWTLPFFITFFIKEHYGICSAGFKFWFSPVDSVWYYGCWEDLFDVNPEKELIFWDGPPKSAEGPNFINKKSLMAICWQRLLSYSACRGRTSDWTPGFPHYTALVYTVWANHCREILVLSFYQWTQSCPFQSELQKLDTSFT